MGLFATVRRHALKGAALVVFPFIEEEGLQPPHVIAAATGYSRRSVDGALAHLRRLGLLKKTAVSHDHKSPRRIEPLQQPAAQKPKRTAADPLLVELLQLGMWEGAARAVLQARIDRDHLQQQLAWHRHRLATGYKFRDDCPARLLTYLLRNPEKDAPPAGYYEAKQRPQEGQDQAQDTPKASRTPVEDMPAKMTRDGAILAVRLGLKSRIPAQRQAALELAEAWGLDTSRLGVTVITPPAGRMAL